MQNSLALLEEAQNQIFFQHKNADGYITLARKVDGNFIQNHYRPEQLAEHLSDFMGEDIFYSQNTFYKPQRRIENVRQLRHLYVDIDCYLLNYDPEWILGKLEHEYFKKKVPDPNLVIFSGQGLVLIWSIEPVPYKALPLWNAVERYLMKQLEELGGDPRATDAARVFRIAGSVNTKCGEEVRVEYRHEYKYALRDIQHDYLPELDPQPKNKPPKRGRKKQVVQLFNTYSLNYARICDITKLVELRKYDVTGYRETICFLYRYWMCCFCNDKYEAYRQTKELNDSFTHPLRENELKTSTRSAELAYEAKNNKEANETAIKNGYPGAGYNISNAKLIKWLDITTEEMFHMSTIINIKEKRRRELIKKESQRRASGIRTDEQRRADDRSAMLAKVEKIRVTLEKYPDLSVRRIVKETGIPRSTVQRLLKHL